MFASVIALAIAAGISPYAMVAVLGLAQRAGWIASLPAQLVAVSNTWVITLAVLLTLVEFVATLVPGVASAWEAAHAALRPPAAALVAVLMMWGGDPALVIAAALVAGTLAFGTSLTKLGARLAIDTSPEPVSNGAASVGEVTLVSLISIFVWKHPVLAAIAAVTIVIVAALLVRAVWGMIWGTVVRSRRPGVGSIRS
jgi:hypothetical protein